MNIVALSLIVILPVAETKTMTGISIIYPPQILVFK